MRISDWSSDVCSSDLLAGIDRDTDHQLVDQLAGPLDDVIVTFGNRIESARVQTDPLPGHYSSPESSPSTAGPLSWPSSWPAPLSGKWATDATFSPSPSLKMMTPWVLRPAASDRKSTRLNSSH